MGEYNSLYELMEAFPTEESCIAHLEAKRWPRGIVCPLCGASRKIYRVKRARGYKCADCKGGFSIRKHSIFERSPIALRKWFAAIWLATSHRKGIPSTQLAREIGVTQKTAWYMLGRIREVMGEMGKRGGPVSEPGIRHLPASLDQLGQMLVGQPVQRYRVVSLFSGCGGMDLGFVGGFPFHGRYYDRLPFEIVWANDLNTAACRTYEANMHHDIHEGDVADLLDTLPASADVVIGGFPCQDVSINNGKSVAERGQRTILYRAMIEVIKRLQPQVFVAENVKGLLSRQAFHKEMTAAFNGLDGYAVRQRLYVASDYGVPQRRERLFITGGRGGIPAAPQPQLPLVTAGEALRDLEDMPETPELRHVWSRAARSPEQGDRRLRADAPATTIRAEHHGNIQWHYRLPRRISLREAARLQSFPDAFAFTGGMRETERQIGNAVPPVLAWHVAKTVREWLDGCEPVRGTAT